VITHASIAAAFSISESSRTPDGFVDRDPLADLGRYDKEILALYELSRLKDGVRTSVNLKTAAVRLGARGFGMQISSQHRVMATEGQDMKESIEMCVFYTLQSDLESWKRLQLQVTIQTVRTDRSRLHDGSRMPSCILDFGDEAHAMIMQTAHKVPLNDWVCILPPCGSDPSNASVVFDTATRQIVASQYAERFNESQGSYLCVIKVCERIYKSCGSRSIVTGRSYHI
jgi:hypothetical protein